MTIDLLLKLYLDYDHTLTTGTAMTTGHIGGPPLVKIKDEALACQKVCKQGRDDVKVKVNIQSHTLRYSLVRKKCREGAWYITFTFKSFYLVFTLYQLYLMFIYLYSVNDGKEVIEVSLKPDSLHFTRYVIVEYLSVSEILEYPILQIRESGFTRLATQCLQDTIKELAIYINNIQSARSCTV